MVPITQLEYQDADGRNPFGLWRAELDAIARTKVTIALARLSLGNVSNVRSVGQGVSELKVDFGPGYRVYFGRDGEAVVIVLADGTKASTTRY
jgi:putative addiction module killer protein